MTINWGPAVADATNAFRVGYEFSQSPSSIFHSTSSVTVTVRLYLQTKYYAYDPSVSWVISGNINDSDTSAFNHTSGTAWSSANITQIATRSRTFTPSFQNSISTSITFALNGLAAIAGTARVSGTWTTPKRPVTNPAEPTGFTATRNSDTSVTLNWTNTSPGSGAAPYEQMLIDRFIWPNGPYVRISTMGVAETVSTGASANSKYSFRIAAQNSAGQSSWVYFGPLATTPATPSNVDAEVNGNDIDVSWSSSATFATEYEVWHRTNGVRDGSPIATLGSTARSWKHVAPNTSQSHSYEIRAKISDVANPINSAYSTPSPSIQLTDDPPLTPTSVTPVTGTVTKPNPALGGTLVAIATGQTQRMQWQFATNNTFTTSVKTVTEPTADLRTSGATTETPSIATLNLSNGTWYMRARAVDKNGVAGPYSATATLTVSTPVPPTPTSVGAGGATVTTMKPTLAATLGVDSAGRQTKAEWMLSKSSSFASGNISIIEADADLRTSGTTTETIADDINRLTSNGTWYIRARAIPEGGGVVSAWSAGVSFTLALPVPTVPTSITPAPNATIATDRPSLTATLAALSEGRRLKAEWQLATNSGFSTNLRTVTESDADLRTSGATTEPVPTTSILFQSIWYLRARGVDEFGNTGAWSSGQIFTVAHRPVAGPTSPANDSVTTFTSTDFSWNFSDPEPSDVQTAYQLIIERNDTGAVLSDSGKIISSSKTRTVSTGSLLKDVKMRWKVRVWDSDDVAGDYSGYRIFTLSDVPTVTITSPASGSVVLTGQPTINWTTDVNTTQATFRVLFKQQVDDIILFDSGVISSDVKTYTAPRNILENLGSYSVTVTVTDNQGLSGSSINTFTTAYEVPQTAVYSVDPAGYDDIGYILIDWSTMNPDEFFVSWNVYRRRAGDQEWNLIASYTDPTTLFHHDWTVTTGDSWEYAVTQSAGRSGQVLDSVIAGTPDSILADGSHYWLINPYDESVNFKLENVSSDSYTDEFEEAELVIIGRGRKINTGTRLGYSGSMVAQLRDSETETARSKRQRLQEIKSSRLSYYLRNPFGDLLLVSVGNLAISRIAGVGTSEYVDVTIPYKEVF